MGVLALPKQETWSGEHVGPAESLDGIWLRLTATEPGTCHLVAGQAAVEAGLRDPVMPPRYPAITEAGSLAYLTLRRASDGARRWELGAIGHGPRAAVLAERICAEVRAWSTERTRQPVITAYQAGHRAPPAASGCIISKPRTRLQVNYDVGAS